MYTQWKSNNSSVDYTIVDQDVKSEIRDQEKIKQVSNYILHHDSVFDAQRYDRV